MNQQTLYDSLLIEGIMFLTGLAILRDSELIFLSLYGVAILIGFSLLIFGLIKSFFYIKTKTRRH